MKPAVINFLNVRGLALSEEKTHITHIDDGFDFLGFNVRKYNGKLLIKPSKKSVIAFLEKIRECIKSNKTVKTEVLIMLLNAKIRGWANYYRFSVAQATFDYVDHQIHQMLWRWATRRHPNKPAKWVQEKYFRTRQLRKWVFSTAIRNKDGHKLVVDLFNASSVVIKRHILIKGDATPYDPAFIDYFKLRNSRRKVGRIKTRGHVTWSGSTLKAKRYIGGWLGHPVA